MATPGVIVTEKAGAPALVPVGTSYAAMLLRMVRGPTDRLGFVANMDEFLRTYGGFGEGLTEPYNVQAFFDQGGSGLYIGRVVGTGALASGLEVLRADKTAGTVALNTAPLRINASSVGAWGDDLLVTTVKQASLSDGAVIATATSIVVDNVGNFQIGDVATITDGTNTESILIYDIDTGTKTLSLLTALANPYASGSSVATTSRHKAVTTLTADFTAGDLQITVANGSAIDEGALLLLIDSTNGTASEFTVTNKVGNVIKLANVNVAGANVAIADAVVVTQGFNITAVIGDDTETHEFLNIEAADLTNRADQRLDRDAEFIEAEISLTIAQGGLLLRSYLYPQPVLETFLAGGNSGTAPTNTEYTDALPLLDTVRVLPDFAIPGASAAVQQAADAYAQNRGNTHQVVDAPLAADTQDELLSYRNSTLNLASSYSSLYAPWVTTNNRSVAGATIDIPPSGHVLGAMSRTVQVRNSAKAPANIVLNNVSDVTARIGDTAHGILNEAGVNIIKLEEGRGIRIMGARTQWSIKDTRQYVNVRHISNLIYDSLLIFGEAFVFENNNSDLWAQIELEGQRFMRNLFDQKFFFPDDNPEEAYYFNTNSSTTTRALIDQGCVRSVVGFSPVLPAEFVKFELNIFRGGGATVNQL